MLMISFLFDFIVKRIFLQSMEHGNLIHTTALLGIGKKIKKKREREREREREKRQKIRM